MASLDHQIRTAAFEWLTHQASIHGPELPWGLLFREFKFRGERVPLLSQQGIFKPKDCELPLSIRHSLGGPYADHFVRDLLRYAYRGTDPRHRDNAGLREAMRRRTPLIYFHAVAKGLYLTAWPVFVVGDDPVRLQFTVALDDARHIGEWIADDTVLADDAGTQARREYVTRTFRARIHQHSFRARVLAAYRRQCAFCRLRHEKLLDAAHIVPDADPEGEPEVTNGLALCKIHHAAYDGMFLGVRPDFVIEVRQSILDEEDGPMLQHGLKALHRQRIQLPRKQELYPAVARLERRWGEFRAGG